MSKDIFDSHKKGGCTGFWWVEARGNVAKHPAMLKTILQHKEFSSPKCE
jgi:hypothetical protein